VPGEYNRKKPAANPLPLGSEADVRLSAANLQLSNCFVEIFSLTPRFNAVNHEGAMEKTV
jgi:hypothetical protein